MFGSTWNEQSKRSSTRDPAEWGTEKKVKKSRPIDGRENGASEGSYFKGHH